MDRYPQYNEPASLVSQIPCVSDGCYRQCYRFYPFIDGRGICADLFAAGLHHDYVSLFPEGTGWLPALERRGDWLLGSADRVEAWLSSAFYRTSRRSVCRSWRRCLRSGFPSRPRPGKEYLLVRGGNPWWSHRLRSADIPTLHAA